MWSTSGGHFHLKEDGDKYGKRGTLESQLENSVVKLELASVMKPR